MFVKYFYFNDYKSFNNFSIILSRIFLFNSYIFLFGNFGVGKTFFTKGFLGDILSYKYFINSASFSKVNIFFLNGVYFYNLDFYNFRSLDECYLKLLNTLSEKNYFFLIEWGKKLLPIVTPDFYIYIFFYSFFSRIVVIKSYNVNFFKLFL